MPFQPSDLFTGGERGCAWDLSDLSNLSQTINGTTPVTAVGQTVGWIRDVSGNNNHWFAASNGTSRPTYQVDSDGKPYLNLDGSNDVLFAATPFNTNTNAETTCIMGIYGAAAVTSNRYPIGSHSSTTTAPFIEPLVNVLSTGDCTFSVRRDDFGGPGPMPSVSSIFNSTKRVMTSHYEGPGSNKIIEIRDATGRPSDGLHGGYTGVLNSNYVMGPNTFTTTRGTMGARGFSTPANFFNGRIYSGIIVNRFLNDAEIKSAEEWVADRVLVTDLPGEATGTSLVVQDAVSASSVDDVTLVPKTTLAVSDASISSVLEAPTLQPRTALAVADLASPSVLGAPTLASAYALAVNPAVSASTLEAPVLTHRTSLSPDSAVTLSYVENVTLGVQGELIVNSAISAASLTTVTLSPRTSLVPANAVSLSTLGSVALGSRYALAVDSATSASILGQPVLSPRTTLAVQDAISAGVLPNVALASRYVLEPDSAVSASILENVALGGLGIHVRLSLRVAA